MEIKMHKEIYFKTINETFLPISLGWMQDNDFRVLIMANPIEKNDQQKWFDELKFRKDYVIWGVMHRENWIGAFGVKGISNKNIRAEYWGYIYPESLRNVGIGRQMFIHCCNYAISQNIQKLWLKVHVNNVKAIRSYLKWGLVNMATSSSEELHMNYNL